MRSSSDPTEVIKPVLFIVAVFFLSPIVLGLILFLNPGWWKKPWVKAIAVAWSAAWVIGVVGVITASRQPEVSANQHQEITENVQNDDAVDEDINKKQEDEESNKDADETKADKQNNSELKQEKGSAKSEVADQAQPDTQAASSSTGQATVQNPSTATPSSASPQQSQTQSVSRPSSNAGGGFPNTTYPPPSGECKIKGNVNSKKEKIYHVPGGQYYDKTTIKPEEGDQLFCSEEEARAAGFRPSER